MLYDIVDPIKIIVGYNVWTPQGSCYCRFLPEAQAIQNKYLSQGVKVYIDPVFANTELASVQSELEKQGFLRIDAVYCKNYITDTIELVTIYNKCHKKEYLDGVFVDLQVYSIDGNTITKTGDLYSTEIYNPPKDVAHLFFRGNRINLRKFKNNWFKTR